MVELIVTFVILQTHLTRSTFQAHWWMVEKFQPVCREVAVDGMLVCTKHSTPSATGPYDNSKTILTK
jgi:hypothetical protein